MDGTVENAILAFVGSALLAACGYLWRFFTGLSKRLDRVENRMGFDEYRSRVTDARTREFARVTTYNGLKSFETESDLIVKLLECLSAQCSLDEFTPDEVRSAIAWLDDKVDGNTLTIGKRQDAKQALAGLNAFLAQKEAD